MVPRFSFHKILDGTVGKTINLEAHPSLLFLGEQLKNKIQQFNNFEPKKKNNCSQIWTPIFRDVRQNKNDLCHNLDIS